jgi:hypothetical protein
MTDGPRVSAKDALKARIRDSGLPKKVVDALLYDVDKAVSKSKLDQIERYFEEELRKSRFQSITPKVCSRLRALIGQSSNAAKYLEQASDEQLIPWLNSRGLSSALSPLREIEAGLLKTVPELQKALQKFEAKVKQDLADHSKDLRSKKIQIDEIGGNEDISAIEDEPAYKLMRLAAWSALCFRLYAEIDRIAREANAAMAGGADPDLIAFVDTRYRAIGRSLCRWPEEASTAGRAARELVNKLANLPSGPAPLNFD